MDSYHRQRYLDAPPDAVRVATDLLMRELWPAQARSIGESDGSATFSVTVDHTDGDVWLTWRRTAQGEGTLVDLVLDEIDAGPDPSTELDQILDLLAARVGVALSD